MISSMILSKNHVVQVYISTDPYADEFVRTIDLKGFAASSHTAAAAGLDRMLS